MKQSFSLHLKKKKSLHQGTAGMYFQLWDGSGSGIAKNFGFGSGIFSKRIINRVFLGIENHDRVFSGTS